MTTYNWYPITADGKFEEKLKELVVAINEEEWEKALPCVQEMLLLVRYIRPVVEETNPRVNRLWNDFENCMKHICSTIGRVLTLMKIAEKYKQVAIKLVNDDPENAALLIEDVRNLNFQDLLGAKKTTRRLLTQLFEKKSEIKEMSKQMSKKMSEQPQR
jgi:hypothetical protein